jgi:hypothetical protein
MSLIELNSLLNIAGLVLTTAMLIAVIIIRSDVCDRLEQLELDLRAIEMNTRSRYENL